ncbi:MULTISPECIES: dihydroorotase [Rhodomicrobium]|uniref:dihydroorotase n=1 Tax=Rhodomicrobium TaxID=1068 RepID=UPI000B4A6787|nr:MULTISPECIES: dihydroorotase [Rhodomicrobium]
MAQLYDLVLRGGTIVNQDGIAAADLGIRGGRISHIGTVAEGAAGESFDASGLHILPGVIDSHVHFREPGGEECEDLESGSRAAVLGGVTAVFDMPNTDPATVNAETLADKVKRARGRMYCDFAFYPGATPHNIEELATLERLEGAAGIKVFMGSSTGDLLVDDPALLRRLLAVVGRRVAFHCEDEARLNARKGLRREDDPASHSEWRDPKAAVMATQLLLQLAREAGKRIHILHVSTAEEMTLIAANRDLATAEVTPHHLMLVAPDAYEQLSTRAQMNPPLRGEAERTALWEGLRQGVVDTIGSDHAPHSLAAKAKPYPASPSGMPGVQSTVPLMLDRVNAGALSLPRFVDLTSAGPARVYGIVGKGRIALGYDADLTVVDMQAERVITNAASASRCGWTPYDGWTVKGWPVATLVRGRVVMREGEITAEADGQPVRFGEALARG